MTTTRRREDEAEPMGEESVFFEDLRRLIPTRAPAALRFEAVADDGEEEGSSESSEPDFEGLLLPLSLSGDTGGPFCARTLGRVLFTPTRALSEPRGDASWCSDDMEASPPGPVGDPFYVPHTAAAAAATTTTASTPSPFRVSHHRGACSPGCPCSYRLEDLETVRVLGTGTFGVVHLVRHRADGTYLAMKTLNKSEIVRLHQVEHVHSEKRILLALNCPFIVQMYRTYQDRQRLYMLMEFVRGGELYRRLWHERRFTRSAATFYAAEIVAALRALHASEVAYRDLKPENLLLTERGHIRLTDFGFAKRVAGGDRTWTLCGTPEYLAPEVIDGSGHGMAADWWSFGILLYEFLAGYPPFEGTTPYETYERILGCGYTFPTLPGFDRDARDLIARLLQRDSVRRIGTPDIMRHPFFRGIVDWDAVSREELEPPFVPVVQHGGDTQNFDEDSEPAWLRSRRQTQQAPVGDSEDPFLSF